MIFDDAQKNMNDAYFGGGTGVLASGLIWSVAGIVAVYSSPQTSMLTLFFGGYGYISIKFIVIETITTFRASQS